MDTDAFSEIFAERFRQIAVEGFGSEHDDNYTAGQLAHAAACYAVSAAEADEHDGEPRVVPEAWPWEKAWWKPTTKRRDLIKAAALIIAEIQRMDRAAAREAEQATQASDRTPEPVRGPAGEAASIASGAPREAKP